MDIYVDGSWSANKPGVVGWAFVLVNNGIQNAIKGQLTGDIVSMHQVGGELKAVMKAIEYCETRPDIIITAIYYDYDGIKKWLTGEWKTKNEYTQAYKNYILQREIPLTLFVKCNRKNNYADMYAKQITGAKDRR